MRPLTKASTSSAVTQRELDNLKVAYDAACEGIVLLKNDGVLPLRSKKLALYGPGASMTIKGGTGSGEVNERHSVSILEGLEDRGFDVTTHDWIRRFEETYARKLAEYKKARKKKIRLRNLRNIMNILMENFRFPVGPEITEEDVANSATDSCIYVLSRQAGEGGDRKPEKGDYFLTDEEISAIRFCAEKYSRFILVINCGSSVDLSFTDEIPGINAILYICQLGTEGGHAFADIVSGQVSPSGKLTDTWAKHYSDIPFSDEYGSLNGDLVNENYREGIYVGYRYFDSFGVEPAYPFGFGLSYTPFSIFSSGVQVNGRTVTVQASVTNDGTEFSGKEVAQLYVSAPAGTMHKEYQSLAAFAKTDSLAPGATETLDLSFDLDCIASYRQEDGCFLLEAGEYVLRLGNSSRNTVPVGVLRLNREIVVSVHDHVCPLSAPLDELQAPDRLPEELNPGLPRITVDPSAFQTVSFNYDTPEICSDECVQAFLNTLTLPEMVEIVVGIGMFGGETKFTLPGSVGNTTSKFWDRGLANVALCDVPAGLRIQKHSVITKKNSVKPVEMAMEVFNLFPGFIKKFMVGNPDREESIYQYTTAFPVSTALAQSWNVRLMERVGTAIYSEMKEYGCTYWLAPAINIHRNPLCGRNFEYFSEDPRLTGLMAAAMTRSVQQEDGFYVTAKHFACNNQEDNRNYVSSNLSERALREIYLRAFREVVVNGGAKSIMTCYNKVNGMYVSNSYDLLTKVLRCEWGFDGVVMTDWFSTGGDKGDTALCMSAGNDLIMPGGGNYKKSILQGVKSGAISQEDVRRCCGNVIQLTLNSATQREYIDC